MTKTALLALLWVIALSFASAQTTLSIACGQTVSGTMTKDEYEFHYGFSGTDGEVVIFELQAVDPFGNLDNPVLMLFDSDGQLLVDTTPAFSFREARLVAQLPADGGFTLVVTRADDETTGDFTLEMIRPTPLMLDAPVTDHVSSTARSRYYVAQAASDFVVVYTRINGDFSPQVSVNRLDPRTGGLKEVAMMSGDKLTVGALGRFAADAMYIVVVGESPLDYNETEVVASYELKLAPNLPSESP